MSTLVNLSKKNLICLRQSILVDDNETCRQENNWKYWRLNSLVWIATMYWWSNRSDPVLINSIDRGPSPAISYFQTERNSIRRDLANRLYRKKGIFYWPNSCTVFNSILPPTITSINFELVNICNILKNLSSRDFCFMK